MCENCYPDRCARTAIPIMKTNCFLAGEAATLLRENFSPLKIPTKRHDVEMMKFRMFQTFALWMLTRLAISILKRFVMFATVYWRILHATKIIFMALFAGRAVIDAAQTLINEPPKAGRPGYLRSSARKREIPFSA